MCLDLGDGLLVLAVEQGGHAHGLGALHAHLEVGRHPLKRKNRSCAAASSVCRSHRLELLFRAGRGTGVGWCPDLPVDRQVRHGSGETLIRREQRAIQIERGGYVQRIPRGDVVSHPPGSVQERTTDRDATNVQASEPS
jgi:hypothetical protein